jgi:hypothetical protein
MGILPERLPEATPDAIRRYILSPPDPAAPKPGERYIKPELTEEDKLEIQASIAASQLAAQEAARDAARANERAAEVRRSVMEGVKPAAQEGSAVSASSAESHEARANKLREDAEQLGIADRVANGVAKALEARGVHAGTEAGCVDFALLSPGELERFERGIQDIKSKGQ